MNNNNIQNHLHNDIATASAQLSSLQSKDPSAIASSVGNVAANSSQQHNSNVDPNNSINFNHMMPRRESIGVVNVLGDALFGRRRSSFGLGGDMAGDLSGLGGGNMMARRGSMDSVVDAAIQNLANRRLSMLGGNTNAAMNANAMNNTIGATPGGMGIPPLGVGPSMMNGGLGMMGMQSQGMDGLKGPMGMNINSNGTLGMSSKMNQFLMNGLGLNSMMGGNNNPVANADRTSSTENGVAPSNDPDMGGTANVRRKQLQDQRIELQRRQKELEFQRQQLLTAMEERKQAMQQMQQTIQQGQQHQPADRRHSLFGGALGTLAGFGSPLPQTTASSTELEQHSNPPMLPGTTERKASMGLGETGSNFFQLENKWRQSRGIRDDRRGSLDLLGSLASVTQEVAVNKTNGLMNKNMKPETSQIGTNGGGFGGPPNVSSSSQLDKSQPSGNFSVIKKPIPLGLPGDKDWLTPLHCFVRLHCVEVFTATKVDVAIPTKGKRKPIQIGQVGIRCPHCHNSETGLVSRERGSVYYPTRYVLEYQKDCLAPNLPPK